MKARGLVAALYVAVVCLAGCKDTQSRPSGGDESVPTQHATAETTQAQQKQPETQPTIDPNDPAAKPFIGKWSGKIEVDEADYTTAKSQLTDKQYKSVLARAKATRYVLELKSDTTYTITSGESSVSGTWYVSHANGALLLSVPAGPTNEPSAQDRHMRLVMRADGKTLQVEDPAAPPSTRSKIVFVRA